MKALRILTAAYKLLCNRPGLFFTSSYAAFLPVALPYLSPSLPIPGSLTSVHLSGLRSE